QPARLHVRRLDDEGVAVPAAGGKAFERVQRLRRRVRTAVQPDDTVHAEGPVEADGLGDPADAIVLRVDDQRVRAPELISRRMRRALMLGNAEPGSGVAFGLADPGLVEREAHEVADLGSLAPIVEVFLTE